MADTKKDLAIKAALMYYEENMTQNEIAKTLYISRSYVSQLLHYARETNIVHIEINIDEGSLRDFQGEDRIRKMFPHLSGCFVMRSSSAEFSISNLGRFAAPILARYINNAEIIGITPGNSVDRTIHQIKEWMLKRDREHIAVQMMGSFNLDKAPLYARPNEVVENLSKILKCSAFYLNCPAFINSRDLRHRLLREKSIVDIFRLWEKMDLIIVGIGNADASSRLFSFYDEDCRSRIENSNACGEINTHHFDINGNYLPLIEDRTICASNEVMKNVGKKVAICAGVNKGRALLGAMRGNYIDTLITDSCTVETIENLLLVP